MTFPPAISPEDCHLFHLNGIAGFHLNSKFNRYSTPLLDQKKHKDLDLLGDYIDGADSGLMQFAWESENDPWKFKFIENMIKDTTIVVVIGYSFPFFNREVDKRIFGMLTPGKLRRIYFQDPVSDGSQLYNQFNLRDKGHDLGMVVHIKDTDAFYVPFEM